MSWVSPVPDIPFGRARLAALQMKCSNRMPKHQQYAADGLPGIAARQGRMMTGGSITVRITLAIDEPHMARYLIGIDLGTTNSALAYVDLQHPRRGDRLDIKSFALPQLTAGGEVKERPLLPSFLYLPGQHDLPAGATALPWDAQRAYAVGEFARNHGGKVPGRLVTSAKSWLCHAGVDRSAGLLAVDRAAGCAAHFACRGIGALPAAHGRKLEPRHGQGSAGRSPGETDRRADRAGVVRRRGPQPDRRGGAQGGAGKSDAAGGAAGGVLLLAGDALGRGSGVAEAGDALPGGGRGRRHQRFQPHRGGRAAGRAGLRAPGGRRSSAAGRRQHGPGPGQVRRDEAARRRPARRGAVRRA